MNKSFYVFYACILSLGGHFLFLPSRIEGDLFEFVVENVHPLPAWMLQAASASREVLRCIDQEKYEDSWLKGDELLQNMISKEAWIHLLQKNRQPLGKIERRTLIEETPVYHPKDLPEGEYMVLVYLTVFEKGVQAKERLAFRRGIDGQWRVLTYHLQN